MTWRNASRSDRVGRNITHGAVLQDVSRRLLSLRSPETGTKIIRPSSTCMSAVCWSCLSPALLHLQDTWRCLGSDRCQIKISWRNMFRSCAESRLKFLTWRTSAWVQVAVKHLTLTFDKTFDPAGFIVLHWNINSYLLVFHLCRFVTAAGNLYVTVTGSKVRRWEDVSAHAEMETCSSHIVSLLHSFLFDLCLWEFNQYTKVKCFSCV